MNKPALPSLKEQAYRSWLIQQEWMDEMEQVGGYSRRDLEICLNDLLRIAHLKPESSAIFMEKHRVALRKMALQHASFKEIKKYIGDLEVLHGRKLGDD